MSSRSKLTAVIIFFVSCSSPLVPDDDPSGHTTKADGSPYPLTLHVDVPQVCQRLNVMLFDTEGNRALSKVITQKRTDVGFGTMGLEVSNGEYIVVAVAHSSAVSASIKSPANVQFTAQDGRKVTPTYSTCRQVTVTDTPSICDITLDVATSQVTFIWGEQPDDVASVRFDYHGGSANFSPSTLQGITHSKQSELRSVAADGTYHVWTFPYLSDAGTLSMTVTAIAASGYVICAYSLPAIPVYRGIVTIYHSDSETFTYETAGADWPIDDIIYY